MRPPDDVQLLTEYTARHSEDAFTALVGRHVGLVYSAALRQVREPALAEEVTQAVFILLARKARTVSRGPSLAGWLCRVAHFVSRDALRAERRRLHHERLAAALETAAGADWRHIAPLLDEVVARLNDRDRSAIVLRFYEQKSLDEVGTALGVEADAAQKRVSRALEKLRRFFAQRGVHSTTTLLSGAISANSVSAAPAGLAQTISAVALAKGAAAGGSTLALVKGALKIMAWTNVKMAITVGVAALLTAGTATLTLKKNQEPELYSWETNHVTYPETLDQAPPQVRILPTKFKFPADYYGAYGNGPDGRLIGIAAPFPTLVQNAFQVTHRDRVIYPADLPAGQFDFIANLRQGSPAALQQEIKRKLGVTGEFQTLETDVLRLQVKYPDAPGLHRSVGKNTWSAVGGDGIADTNRLMSAFASQLEDLIKIPVVDQTGLTGPFEFHLFVHAAYWNVEALKPVLLDQLGLELVPAREPLEMLVLKRVK